jgi:hypothetical protein
MVLLIPALGDLGNQAENLIAEAADVDNLGQGVLGGKGIGRPTFFIPRIRLREQAADNRAEQGLVCHRSPSFGQLLFFFHAPGLVASL